MTDAAPLKVYLVDDNLAFRRSIVLVLETSGMEVHDFDTPKPLLAELERSDQAAVARDGACVITDIRMPGMSGLELLEELKRRQYNFPVIVITAHADVPLAVEAMRRGAVNFIEKPFAVEVLIEALRLASVEASTRASAAPKALQPNPKLANLTRRERQVLELVVSGKFNKTIADILGISTKTVELHRASVMTKLGVRTLPDLVKVYLGHQ